MGLFYPTSKLVVPPSYSGSHTSDPAALHLQTQVPDMLLRCSLLPNASSLTLALPITLAYPRRIRLALHHVDLNHSRYSIYHATVLNSREGAATVAYSLYN